jgi:hypothetical protein
MKTSFSAPNCLYFHFLFNDTTVGKQVQKCLRTGAKRGYGNGAEKQVTVKKRRREVKDRAADTPVLPSPGSASGRQLVATRVTRARSTRKKEKKKRKTTRVRVRRSR